MKKLYALALSMGLMISVAVVPTATSAENTNLPYLNEIKKM